MTRFLQVVTVFSALSAVAWLGGCSDEPTGPSGQDLVPLPEIAGLVLSDPTPPAAVTAGAGSSSVLASAEEDVSYVSLAPGTEPAGYRATVRRVGDAASLTAPVVDGGFDPVPIAAQAGDSIEVLVTDAGGATLFLARILVLPRRRPVVVRTDPPRSKTDVPLNSVIVVVLSEPVGSGSITSSSVQLFRGTTPIAGTPRLLAGTATSVVFEPSATLDANTGYRLVVTDAVRDLDGDPLEAETTVEFTTGTTVLGPVASVRVAPDSLEVAVGTQFQLRATALDTDGNVVPGRSTRWSSTNPLVATVSSTGIVTALTEGFTDILAEVDGVTGGTGVLVSASLTAIGSVTLIPSSAAIALDATVELLAEIRDTTGAIVERPRPILWTSSDPAVATVVPIHSRSALVTGVSAGIAKIAATIEGKSDTATITVSPVASVVVTPESAAVVVYGTAQLTAVLLDASGTTLSGGSVAWSSEAVDVATVDSTGLVTGVSAGATFVVATSGGVSDTSAITVSLVPGGRIAFWSDRDGNLEIYAMNTDGSGVVRLTHDPAPDAGPAWSPDGTKIAFTRGAQIYVMNADGSETSPLADGYDPAWSPDGTRIAGTQEDTVPAQDPHCRINCFEIEYRIFVMDADGSNVVVVGDGREPAWSPDAKIAFVSDSDIFVMNPDGSGLSNLTNDPASDTGPAWSPDGTRIAFRSNRTGVYDLYVMNADGSGVMPLTGDPATEGRPAWSPDGTKIAFASDVDGDYDIYVMNADGSGITRLTDHAASDARPAWTP